MVQNLNPDNAVNLEFEEREAQKKAQKLGLDYINIAKFPINPDVLKLVEKDFCEKAKAVPFFRNAKKLKIAVFDSSFKNTKEFVEYMEEKDFEVELFICSKHSLQKAFDVFGSKFLNQKIVEIRSDFDEKEHETFESQFIQFAELEERIKTFPTEKALNEIQIFAIRNKVSDIHLQPNEKNMVLRFRVDGILHDICEIGLEQAKNLVSRIKYESGMKSNIYDLPQDGHLSFIANDRRIDMRISSLPTEYLESIVMRVLDSRKGIKKFSELGFDDKIQEKIQSVIHQKNGMILVTGPTGSGKTTTLYSMLSEINDEAKKIVTLEDPIEYHLQNITQSQVDEKQEYNFSTGLKALLRHDPDTILIGEIREFSTAKLASEAALTGHLVFSSLHTNSAIGAITRLRNLGLESYNISGSINAVFAQRLVRKVCSSCAKKVRIGLDENSKIKVALDRLKKLYPEIIPKAKDASGNFVKQMEKDIEVLEPTGCEACSHTGYVGRTVLCEVLILDNVLREKISDGETEFEINNYLLENTNQLSLFEDGIRKVHQIGRSKG